MAKEFEEKIAKEHAFNKGEIAKLRGISATQIIQAKEQMTKEFEETIAKELKAFKATLAKSARMDRFKKNFAAAHTEGGNGKDGHRA